MAFCKLALLNHSLGLLEPQETRQFKQTSGAIN